MRPIDHTLKSHDARKHEPYSFHRDMYSTWKVQVIPGQIAHIMHHDGRVDRLGPHPEGTDGHEIPKASRLTKMEDHRLKT